MDERQSGEYSRTGAPPPFTAGYRSEDGREPPSKFAQYKEDNSSFKQLNGHSTGQLHSPKEKVIAIARVWNEVIILLQLINADRHHRHHAIISGSCPV